VRDQGRHRFVHRRAVCRDEEASEAAEQCTDQQEERMTGEDPEMSSQVELVFESWGLLSRADGW
jgi:hypothetical protein